MSFGGFYFSSTVEMNGSKQHPTVPFTLSTRSKDLVLTWVIYHTTWIIMHAKDPIFFSSLGLIMTKAHVNFQIDPISSFREKVEQTDGQMDRR